MHSVVAVVTLDAKLLVHSADGSSPEVDPQGPRLQTIFNSLHGFTSGKVWCTKEERVAQGATWTIKFLFGFDEVDL